MLYCTLLFISAILSKLQIDGIDVNGEMKLKYNQSGRMSNISLHCAAVDGSRDFESSALYLLSNKTVSYYN